MCRCTASTREPAVTVVEVGTGVGGLALFPRTTLLMLDFGKWVELLRAPAAATGSIMGRHSV